MPGAAIARLIAQARASRQRPFVSVKSGRLERRDGSYASMPRLDQDALGAIIPDVHLGDLAVPHHKAVHVAVALEGGPILPFAVERADAIDHGLAVAGADVEPVHLLLDPTVTLGVEGGRAARMIELAPAGKGDHRARRHVGRRGIRIGDHGCGEIGFHDRGIGQWIGFSSCGNGHGSFSQGLRNTNPPPGKHVHIF
ncbi:hypothetical protein ACVW0I_003480 [Bradyrhizobium sp. LM6.11]